MNARVHVFSTSDITYPRITRTYAYLRSCVLSGKSNDENTRRVQVLSVLITTCAAFAKLHTSNDDRLASEPRRQPEKGERTKAPTGA